MPVEEALERLDHPARRVFLQHSLTLGGLSLVTGCSITDTKSVETALMKVCRFNDKVQAWLFDPNRLAPTYPESMITRPFPFNAYYDEDQVPKINADSLRLEITGLVAHRKPWALRGLQALPQTD
jgi:DMSO/TMAO reductase YedYZ molybdopterin-dependent catalytic subunit